MQAELIFTGGPVLSAHNRWRPAEALAVGGGRILAFGSNAEVMHTSGPGTRVVNLEGRPLIPGLIDAHLHMIWYARSLDLLPISGLPDLGAVRSAVAKQARNLPPGTWVVGRGWDQDRWAERREPTRHDLDEISPEHPVLLVRNCGHVAVANSLALKLAGIDRSTPDPAGGQIDRDPATGEPNGLVRELAVGLIHRAIPEVSRERLATLLRQAVGEALSYGITQVHTDDLRSNLGFQEAESLFRSVSTPESLPFRFTQMIPVTRLDEAGELGVRTAAGDPWYRYGQVKIFADGSLGGRTAALLEPYADKPSTKGMYIHPREEFIELVSKAHALGNQVGCHSIGDAAAELFIDAVSEAQQRHWRPDHRHRMIHCQILNEELIQRMRANLMVGDIQPVFIKSDGYWFAERVGAERARTSYAWKRMQDHGIPLCGGSDCPVEPLNIWYGIYCAVTRRDLNGHPPGGWAPDQALSVAETLDMFTIGGSYATFEEKVKGSLQPGTWADLAILDRNPFTCDPLELKEMKVQATYVGGRLGYEA